MRFHKIHRAAAAAGLALAAGACTSAGAMNGSMAGMPASGSMDHASAARMMVGWHSASVEAADAMMAKYGAPDEMTPTMAVWHNNGPWKRTIIHSQAVQHNFPMPHPDVLEQVIDYQVPVEMFSALAAYDGSVFAERTKGEMAARCDKEGANFLALNLAHEIATGARNVADARRMYGEQIQMMKAGRMTPYTSGLIFTPPANAGDPDRPIM